MQVELLWFEGCPNHLGAESMLREVMAERGVSAALECVEVPDEATGNELCFPGSPTIRIDGVDIEPGWEPCDDCTPRCRVYATPEGLRGLPPREWVVEAVRLAS